MEPTSSPPNSPAESTTEISTYRDWGFPLSEVYRLAIKFYREKHGKAFHLPYKDKISFVAYYNQAHLGQFSDENAPPVGALDMIGQERRAAWQALGSLSKDDAKVCVVDLIEKSCPLFYPYAEAHFQDLAEKTRRAEEAAREEELAKALQDKAKLEEQADAARKEKAKQRVQDALNAQTYAQFKAYAEQQFPGNPDQQAVLIRQLQEQHYSQYMQQIAGNSTERAENENGEAENSGLEDGNDSEDLIDCGEGYPPVQAASMWTRKDMDDFKKSVREEGTEAVIKVGHGETVTVRVPTHEDGACLFWEFATDDYDLGFGLYFEWTKSDSNLVSVHVSDSDDEEDESELLLDETDISKPKEIKDDVEAVGDSAKKGKPPTCIVIPVYRRDCQEEVYAGCHVYPGTGVYLLKFDNSYSLWRSKTLYYRVYYTR